MKSAGKLIWVILLMLVRPVFAQTVPVINSVEPVTGSACEVISVSGYNFETDARVFFGAVEGTVVGVSDQLIEVEVPVAATFDHISVLNPSERSVGYSTEKFLPSFGGTTGLSLGDFSTQTDLNVNTGLYDVCLCDLNGDGKSEIIGTSNAVNKIDIMINNSTTSSLSFSRREITIPAVSLNIACGDLNGDGKQDLVLSEGADGSRLFILQNNSTPSSLSFSASTYTIPGSSTKRPVIRDIDFDGRADIVVTDQSLPNVYIIKNASNGAIALDPAYRTLTLSGAVSTSGIIVDDFDDDRRPDILVTQFLAGNGGYFVAKNNGSTNTISFSAFQKFNTPGALFNVISARLNNDSRPDFAGTQFTENMMSLFGNTSTASSISFTGATYVPSGLRPWGIDGGDLDGDGNVDFAVATTGTSLAVAVMNGNGSGVFTPLQLPATYINRNVRIGDINGDGKPDVVYSSVDDQVNAIPASKISIFQNAKCHMPVIEPTGPLTLCTGFTESLEVQCIAGATYIWKIDGSTVQSGASNTLDATVSGTYTVTVNLGSCSTTSDPVEVTVKSGASLPPAIISANSPVCAGQTLNLSSNDVGATTYSWRGPGGFTATGRNVSVPDFRIANAGRYDLDIYSGDCLIQSTSIVVEATPAPEFQLVSQSGGKSFCAGETATLQIIPNVSGFDYAWFDQNGAIAGATSDTYEATSGGEYYVEITDQVSGCPKITTEVFAISFVPLPTASFEAPAGVCAGSAVVFTNTSSVTGDAYYFWDFGDGSTSTEKSPVHAFTNQQTYNVSLTVNYGDATCQDIVTQQIVVADGLQVNMNTEDVTICEGQSVELSPIGTYQEYLWQDGSGNATFIASETGTYTVQVRDNTGCEGTASVDITVSGIPDVQITATPSAVPPGEDVVLAVTGLTTYAWEPADVLDDPSSASPVAILNETTRFTVTGETDTGCQATAEIVVHVSGDLIGENLHPKNFFSPNDGDMINATWEIGGILDYPDCEVEVYDQAGNLMYQAKPYLNDWDGTSSGQMVPDGAYYFVIRCDGSKPVKSGSVTILRN